MFGAFGHKDTSKDIQEILDDTITAQELEVINFAIFSYIFSHENQS